MSENIKRPNAIYFEDYQTRYDPDYYYEKAEADAVFNKLEQLLAAEQAKNEVLEKDSDNLLTERDRYYDLADNFANAIANHFEIDIGEHSNMNDPFGNAMEVILSAKDEEKKP